MAWAGERAGQGAYRKFVFMNECPLLIRIYETVPQLPVKQCKYEFLCDRKAAMPKNYWDLQMELVARLYSMCLWIAKLKIAYASH